MSDFKINVKDALAEIKKLIDEIERIKNTTKSTSSATTSSFNKIDDSIKKVRLSVASMGQQLNYANAIMNKTASNTKKVARELKNVDKSSKKLSVNFLSMAKAGGALFAFSQLRKVAIDAYENTKAFDSLDFTMQKITKTNQNYSASLIFMNDITEKYGVEIVATTTRWLRFLAAANEANLALKDTERIFESVTKAASVLGLKTDELEGVYLALEQMLSKGKVTTEELRRQLGERLPGAFGIMATAIGVTLPELDKMLKRGEVLSAEVLPKFALALESAYGIEQQERIETIVAKQNRLTNAWQNFIKSIGEGDGVLRSVLGYILDALSSIGNALAYISGGDEFRLTIDLEKEVDNYEKYLARMSRSTITAREKMSQTYSMMQNDIDELRKKMNEPGVSPDDFKQYEEQLNNKLAILTEYNKKVEDESLRFAKTRVASAGEEVKAIQSVYDKYNELVEKQNNNKIPVIGSFISTKEDIQNAKDLSDILDSMEVDTIDDLYDKLLKARAEYSVLFKLTQEGNGVIFSDDEVEKTQITLRTIKDYYLKTVNEIASYVAKNKLDLFNDEDLNFRDRVDALKEYVDQSILIRKNEFEIAKQNAENANKAEIISLEKSIAKGTLSRARANKQIEALEKEKNDFIRFEAVKLSNDLLEINANANKKIEALSKSNNENNLISGVEDQFNKRIIAAKKAYSESKKTVKDEEKLQRELADISVELANEVADVKIGLLNDEIANLKLYGDKYREEIGRIEKEINKINASRPIKPVIDKDEWKKVFEESIELARDFINSIGDIFDSVFERRIENINAEIEAEEAKYDRLIALAARDDEQKATLERNKQERIKKLEADRLKMQQKQAKANKAFAITDISINTARAILGIWADFPKADFGITAAIMTGVVAALGLAQIAAVAAQPIPQYKDGSDNIPSDQIAMINDGGFKEYIERNNQILSTNKKNAIVPLKKGDIVYRNYSDMIKKSPIYNPVINSANTLETIEIEKAITKGFSKAKINNNVNIKQNDFYKNYLSHWN